MRALAELECRPCRGGDPPLSELEISELSQLLPDWQVIEQDGIPQLARSFRFEDFAQALAFTNQVGALAEAADHHPAILTEWGRVTIRWWTHVLRSLHRNDFILAARTSQLYNPD